MADRKKRITRDAFAELIGLELSVFTERAQNEVGADSVRIVKKDGESRMVTKDMRRGRVNVEVETKDGKEIVTLVSNMG